MPITYFMADHVYHVAQHLRHESEGSLRSGGGGQRDERDERSSVAAPEDDPVLTDGFPEQRGFADLGTTGFFL